MVFSSFAAEVVGGHLCASSTTTRSHSVGASFACRSSLRASWSSRAISSGCCSKAEVADRGLARAVGGEDLEREPELQVQLVLPLLDEAARGDDQAALESPRSDQLLDVEPGHDRLAGARVVGEQEAQRLARQQLAVDGRIWCGSGSMSDV